MGKVGHCLLDVIPTHLLHWHTLPIPAGSSHCSPPHFSTTSLRLLLAGLRCPCSPLLSHAILERQQWSIYTITEDTRASHSSTVQQDVVQLPPAQVEWNHTRPVEPCLKLTTGIHIIGFTAAFNLPVLRSLPELHCHCHSDQINWQKFWHDWTYCNSSYSCIQRESGRLVLAQYHFRPSVKGAHLVPFSHQVEANSLTLPM